MRSQVMNKFVGIDVGASGGIVVLRKDRSVALAVKMPETERDLVNVLAQHAVHIRGESFALIERVWSSPQMGVASAFKFGVNVGTCRMALVALGIPFEEVLPSHWQKALGCLQPKRPKGTPNPIGSKDKNITKRRAQALFPEMTVTHAIADALLIAEFCRRLHSGAASLPATPAQQELYGKESEEDRRAQERADEEGKEHRREEEGQRAAQAAPGDAARDGAAEDHAHRERRPRLRRRA